MWFKCIDNVVYKRCEPSMVQKILSRTEEPVKTGTCARDRRALQQPVLNMHVKHSHQIRSWYKYLLSNTYVGCTSHTTV